MKLRAVLLILLLMGLGSEALWAGGVTWPALDPAIWAIRPDQYPDQPGAVVLLDRYHFHRKSVERFRRVLVLTEAGREHADLQLGGVTISQLEGRTLMPDGKEQPFVQGRDVVKREAILGKREREEAYKVFPPGVTSHCLVDLHWIEVIEEPERRPLPAAYGNNLLLSLSSQIPVKRAELVFDYDISDGEWRKKFELEPGQKRTEGQKDGQSTYTLDDIPARQRIPLASKADTLRPLFNWYWSPQVREWLAYLGLPGDKPISILDAGAQTYLYEWLVEAQEKDKALKGGLQGLAKLVPPGEPHARAQALIRLLRSHVRTLGESSDQPDRKLWSADLSRVLSRGWGTSEQLTRLGFLLLREAGLEPVLVMAIDREESRIIDANNLWQYDEYLVGVRDGKGQWLYLDPGSTFDALRMPSWLQGGRALQVIPGAKRLDWHAAFVDLPIADSDQNGAIWKARLVPGEEADAYTVAMEATGSMASRWKRRVQAQQVPEPLKALAPLLDRGRFRLTSANGEALTDPWKGFQVAFEGSLEHDGGRHRALRPFPFLDLPFALPDTWPETRRVGIHLPMACRIQAECRLAWPGGAPAPELEPLKRENFFGKVVWSAGLEGQGANQDLVVRLELTVVRPVGGGYQQEQLKAFIGWIREALGRTLEVPRS